MVDTVVFRVPLSPVQVWMVARSSSRVVGLNPAGEVEWEVMRGQEASWVRGVRWRLRGMSIEIQASLPKVLYGHNVGCLSGVEMCEALYMLGAGLADMGCWVPYVRWQVLRVDVPWMWEVGADAVGGVLNVFRYAYYPRRRTIVYDTAVMWPGDWSTLRVYAKGPEFKRHDGRVPGLQELQAVADACVRVELQLNAEGLAAAVGMPRDARRAELLWPEVLKWLHRGGGYAALRRAVWQVTRGFTIRTPDEVRARLIRVYGSNKGVRLFGVWVQAASYGKAQVFSEMKRATAYRAFKDFQDAGVPVVDGSMKLSGSPTLFFGHLDIANGAPMQLRKIAV